MKRDEAQCQDCCATDRTLNVHHKYYIHGRDIWDYPDWALVTLCEECHKALDPSLRDEWESSYEHLDGTLWGIGAAATVFEYSKIIAKERGIPMDDVIGSLVKHLKEMRASNV